MVGPTFQGQDRIFIGSLLLSFHLEIAGPGDFIIREGTHGRCMYILQRGHVKVIFSAAAVVDPVSRVRRPIAPCAPD